jgi:hypothetical protein
LSEGTLTKTVLAAYKVELPGNTEAKKLREMLTDRAHHTLKKIVNSSGSMRICSRLDVPSRRLRKELRGRRTLQETCLPLEQRLGISTKETYLVHHAFSFYKGESNY